MDATEKLQLSAFWKALFEMQAKKDIVQNCHFKIEDINSVKLSAVNRIFTIHFNRDRKLLFLDTNAILKAYVYRFSSTYKFRGTNIARAILRKQPYYIGFSKRVVMKMPGWSDSWSDCMVFDLDKLESTENILFFIPTIHKQNFCYPMKYSPISNPSRYLTTK